jgi:ubiquinone/menaquinone biosynthesis C-methylase UbiE
LFQKDYWERKALEDRRPPDHPVVRHYVASKMRGVESVVPLDPALRALEVGCGNGFFSLYLESRCDTVGVDFSRKMLERNPLKKKLQMDAARLCFQDMSFDLVFCHALLHHVQDLDAVLGEMRRVSRKYVVLMEPNRNNPLMALFSALVPEERKALRFSMDYLKAAAARNRLRVAAAFSHGMTVPNKTPLWFLPLAGFLDFRQPWGMTHILVAQRDGGSGT